MPRPPTSSAAGGGASAFASRVLLLLTVLPLTLAAFAFVLQWRGEHRRGGLIWPDEGDRRFPGMDHSPLASASVSKISSSSASADCAEILGSSPSVVKGGRFGLFGSRLFDPSFNLSPKIGIAASTSATLVQILPWLYYHKVIGVWRFFLFVEGEAAKPAVSSVLESIDGVKVIYRTKELEERQARSRIWNETWLSGFFYKPCNYELFVKQSLNMEIAIAMARDAGMDWIIHLDTDELIYPGGAPEYSVGRLLADVPENVDMVIFPNYESSIERDDIKDPFTEVSMFKKNYDHLPKDSYFGMYKESVRNNPNYFLTYGNGKSAARVQEHLRPNGAHRWHNYMKTPNEIKLEEAAILHYTYTKFSDLTSRRDRCGCKPTTEDVKRCFILEFDRLAFIVASTATEEEMRNWFREHVVWTDRDTTLKLLRKGIMTRIYAPMTIIRGLRESGVFTSVIASSKNRKMRHISSGNVPSSDLSGISSTNDTTLRKGVSVNSQATARKILQVKECLEAAVPPMSPPGLPSI